MDVARMREARLPFGRFGFSSIRTFAASAVLAAAVGLAGCSSNDELPYEERPVEQIYNTAMDHMEAGRYLPATKEFDEVERQHPYSEWARRSMLMNAYANYKINQYNEAILSAQRFISLHPSNRDVPYAYYLIGLSYYEQISDVGRDQKMTENALAAFTELARRFPQSEYARDARLKIDLTHDHLAGKEMEIGRYYLKRRDYIAAINRFRVVVEKYQTTTHTPEALQRLTEAYLSLGVAAEAQTAAAILGYNFPGSEWYEDSYALLANKGLEPVENKDSWISRAWKTVF
ncbi:outer membrane protein assembly factor BamD [Parvibaculum sp.]|jgi:outer membrane protein assembly factor BamD|uniref:outer membrane protein assembly factor BamD n=1 Tax=Parvibaculum sp. TaxID=2024848 RepID=UPI002A2589F6|nr:outer membrane protein assembly factor BamD [Parvibaculum sp.]